MTSANPHASPDAGSIRFKRLRLGALLLGPLIILAFVCSSAYDAWRSYRYSLAATDREITNIANALAEQTAWTFQAVDVLLLDTARWYRSESGGVPPERINAVLQDRTGSVQQVRQVMIVDAQGNQRYGSRGSAPPGHNVSDRSYFIAQRDGTAAGLFMSEPLLTRSEGHAALILSRRLTDEKGELGALSRRSSTSAISSNTISPSTWARAAPFSWSATTGRCSRAIPPPRMQSGESSRRS